MQNIKVGCIPVRQAVNINTRRVKIKKFIKNNRIGLIVGGITIILLSIYGILFINFINQSIIVVYKIISNDDIRYGIGGYFSLPAKNYLNPYNTYKFNDLEVFVLAASHDIDTINFVIKNKEETLVYITDTGYISKKNLGYLSNADYYFFESNHDVKMLMESNRPIFLKKRILSDNGHLSNETASEYLIGEKTKEIMFIHLSDVANTKDVCINTFNNIATKRNKDITKLTISCAERYSISKGGKRD